jgi:hypothetical protein
VIAFDPVVGELGGVVEHFWEKVVDDAQQRCSQISRDLSWPVMACQHRLDEPCSGIDTVPARPSSTVVCQDRSMSGYDVIGDIHGHADKLTGLLRQMGYEQRSGAWRHAERTAVFVGDLIDRGPQQRESIEIPRAMVEAGSAHMVLGNHEFNAIAYAQWNEERSDYRRSRLGKSGKKHLDQHAAFIDQIGLDTPGHRDAIAWFRTLPLWLDLDGLRVVHACWNDAEIDRLRPLVNEFGGVTDEIIIDGTTKGSAAYRAIETIVKGPEIDLGGLVYLDKGGDRRGKARRRWWDESARTLRDIAEIPVGTEDPEGGLFAPLPETPVLDAIEHAYAGDAPVIVGHYWKSGTPAVLGPKAACVDYSAGKGGPLVAYQWSGETELVDAHFVSFG